MQRKILLITYLTY